ncbi:MAG: family 78 glycoside hydrolase catalytic domain [Phycisphaerales bacterium]
MNPISRLSVLTLGLGLAACPHASAQPNAPAYLRCEYLTQPTCVEAARPRFCWEVSDPRPGAVQSAYEIIVAPAPLHADDQPDRDAAIWRSGKVESPDTCQVEYAGSPLKPATTYSWIVRTWDAQGNPSPWSSPANFTTALPAKDWHADWIGDATPPPAPARANNGFHTQFANEFLATKWVLIDLGAQRTIDAVRLWPARPYDFSPDSPGFCFPRRFRVEVAPAAEPENWSQVYELIESDQPSPGTNPVEIAFNPVTARYVRVVLVMLREATPGKFAAALAEMQVLSGGDVVSQGASVRASDSIETGPWGTSNLTDGDLVSHNTRGWESLPAPMFRKDFTLSTSPVRRATLYASALGVYEARINGARVGEQQLAPEWTDYLTRVQYQAYDVTPLLRAGANAIGFIVGDGWYAGRLGMAQSFTPDKRPRAVYGRQPRLLAHVRVEHADGSIESIVTDSTWLSTIQGPVVASDLLDGESFDARRQIPGWDQPNFSGDAASGWNPVVPDSTVKTALVAQINEPIRARETIKPRSIAVPASGVFVFDLGQNMPGWCRITVKGDPGSVVTLRHVEAVSDNGMIYTANLRGAPQVDHYTLRGDPAGESWEPRFTYHGFRFVEWTTQGRCDPPTIDSLAGVVVCSDPPVVSTFECSNPMLNKLWSNILWTQHANMMSVPTDCPQRDERLGWMGDILAFAPNACFNKDMAAFIAKWSRDVRDAQADDGRFPDIAPHPYGKNERFTGVPAWGDAGVFVPWTAYLFYADTRLIADQFEAARRWVDWIHSNNPDLLWKNKRHNDYNDWLNGDTLIKDGWPRKGANVPNDVFATAFFARSTWIVSQMARVLGDKPAQEKYARLYSSIRQAFINNYVGDDAQMPGDTQAGYALALAFDLLPPDRRDSAVRRLVAGIQTYDNHLSTGFHSTHHAMLQLTAAGRTDLAHQIAANTTFPSWGYSIENGATTIWERWDGYVKGRGFQDPGMNSLNHWALGSVGEWMMRTIVGISLDESSPGFSAFTIAPRPPADGSLSRAAGSYRSIRGTIRSSWQRERDGATSYVMTIPPNTSATVCLPVAPGASVTESGRAIDKHPLLRTIGINPPRGTDGPQLLLHAPAGTYTFIVK